jgi:RHS repeat-associated protein
MSFIEANMNNSFKIIIVITLLIILLTGLAFAADQVYFYYTDPAGTPLAMSDASGVVVWRADYLPFGEESIDLATVQNNKMFVGKERDSESGLYYFGSRYMDAIAGRFASPDPVGAVDPRTGKINSKLIANPQRINVYSYGLNNPYRYVDADGGWPEEAHNLIIENAFFRGSYKLPERVREIFKKASVHVDNDQDPAHSYKHHMRGPNQTAEQAASSESTFISEKIQKYKSLMAEGKSNDAYFALGEAFHPLMDSTSPAHEGYQLWQSIWAHPMDAVGHASNETMEIFNHNIKYQDSAAELIQRLYDKANR